MKKLFSLLFVTLLVFSINLMGCEGVGNEDSTISPHVHDLIKINAVEATYDSVGNIEHYKCKSENCGLLFVDGEAKTQISLKDVVIPVKLRPITFITDELVYEFDDEPECLFYSNVNEIVLADVCIPNSTNARLNTGYAKGFWGLDYIYLKEDLLGDFVVEFNVDVTATYHFVFEIFVIEDDVYERRVTNFKIGNSKEIM
ncbi:MAG: hypothetical protein J6Q38_00795, partial [Clostridia bacterium]|nr:hypothetical protein [Clostridia bacterium]